MAGGFSPLCLARGGSALRRGSGLPCQGALLTSTLGTELCVHWRCWGLRSKVAGHSECITAQKVKPLPARPGPGALWLLTPSSLGQLSVSKAESPQVSEEGGGPGGRGKRKGGLLGAGSSGCGVPRGRASHSAANRHGPISSAKPPRGGGGVTVPFCTCGDRGVRGQTRSPPGARRGAAAGLAFEP